jgi:hypothetical protein
MVSGKEYSISHYLGCTGFESEEKLLKFEGEVNSILKMDQITAH